MALGNAGEHVVEDGGKLVFELVCLLLGDGALGQRLGDLGFGIGLDRGLHAGGVPAEDVVDALAVLETILEDVLGQPGLGHDVLHEASEDALAVVLAGAGHGLTGRTGGVA